MKRMAYLLIGIALLNMPIKDTFASPVNFIDPEVSNWSQDIYMTCIDKQELSSMGTEQAISADEARAALVTVYLGKNISLAQFLLEKVFQSGPLSERLKSCELSLGQGWQQSQDKPRITKSTRDSEFFKRAFETLIEVNSDRKVKEILTTALAEHYDAHFKNGDVTILAAMGKKVVHPKVLVSASVEGSNCEQEQGGEENCEPHWGLFECHPVRLSSYKLGDPIVSLNCNRLSQDSVFSRTAWLKFHQDAGHLTEKQDAALTEEEAKHLALSRTILNIYLPDQYPPTEFYSYEQIREKLLEFLEMVNAK